MGEGVVGRGRTESEKQGCLLVKQMGGRYCLDIGTKLVIGV